MQAQIKIQDDSDPRTLGSKTKQKRRFNFMNSYYAYTLAFIYAQSSLNYTYVGLFLFFFHPKSNSKCSAPSLFGLQRGSNAVWKPKFVHI